MNINDYVSDPYPLFSENEKSGEVRRKLKITHDSKNVEEMINILEKELREKEKSEENMQQVKADEGREPGDD